MSKRISKEEKAAEQDRQEAEALKQIAEMDSDELKRFVDEITQLPMMLVVDAMISAVQRVKGVQIRT